MGRRQVSRFTICFSDNVALPDRPKNLGYVGSEEFIRLQFEEYLLALLSSVKYRIFLESKKDELKEAIIEVDGDPSNEFGSEWVTAWMQTENFRLFNNFAGTVIRQRKKMLIGPDSHIFDIVDPKHPCSGGLTVEDIQRRLAQYGALTFKCHY
jgi:hypothetical protein